MSYLLQSQAILLITFAGYELQFKAQTTCFTATLVLPISSTMSAVV